MSQGQDVSSLPEGTAGMSVQQSPGLHQLLFHGLLTEGKAVGRRHIIMDAFGRWHKAIGPCSRTPNSEGLRQRRHS
jgi:hypothetical protein